MSSPKEYREAVELAAKTTDNGKLFTLDRLATLHQLRAAADELIEEEVTELRRNRTSWDRIGSQIGLSAQGAQKRYKATAPRERYRY